MCRCKTRNDTPTFRSHFFETPGGETRHIYHQPTDIFDRFGIERKPVFPFSHKIRHTTASIRNDYRQARCHGFINHKTPLFRRARVHERISERIVCWKFSILDESSQVHVTMQPEVGDQAADISLQRPITEKD
jgi:hypothetical protein